MNGQIEVIKPPLVSIDFVIDNVLREPRLTGYQSHYLKGFDVPAIVDVLHSARSCNIPPGEYKAELYLHIWMVKRQPRRIYLVH